MRNSSLQLALLTCIALIAGGCATLDAGVAPPPSSTVTPTSDPTTTAPSLPPPPPTNVSLVVPKYLCEPVDIGDSNFASGSATLVGFEDDLSRVANQLTELNRLGVPATITIVGHTDKIPSQFPGGNAGLSNARAAAVQQSLIGNRKVRPEWIAASYGVADTQPKELGDDAASLAANRRVEVTFNCP
jgi:outer membrane protein OmpA-like peptidoglycan-associated protein